MLKQSDRWSGKSNLIIVEQFKHDMACKRAEREGFWGGMILGACLALAFSTAMHLMGVWW